MESLHAVDGVTQAKLQGSGRGTQSYSNLLILQITKMELAVSGVCTTDIRTRHIFPHPLVCCMVLTAGLACPF